MVDGSLTTSLPMKSLSMCAELMDVIKVIMEVKILFETMMSLGYRKNIRRTSISSSGGSLNTRNKIFRNHSLYKRKQRINKKVCSIATVNI